MGRSPRLIARAAVAAETHQAVANVPDNGDQHALSGLRRSRRMPTPKLTEAGESKTANKSASTSSATRSSARQKIQKTQARASTHSAHSTLNGKKLTQKQRQKQKLPRNVLYCPLTGHKVTIQKATVKDLKNKSIYHHVSARKILWTIPSDKVRDQRYEEAAVAIATVEQSLLPSYGGRSWEVTCILSESNSQVLFRAFRGEMELACLPHLIQRIPEPPAWPGRRKTRYNKNDIQEEFGMAVNYDDNSQSLQARAEQLGDREVSALSTVAYELRPNGGSIEHTTRYPVPNVVLRFKSPDCKTFSSRKSAWDHAMTLCERQVALRKHLEGIGSSGKRLYPTAPSIATTLQAGLWRFERDGLWIVGQEVQWQNERVKENDREAELKNKTLKTNMVETAKYEANVSVEPSQSQKNRGPTAVSLFLAENRELYRCEQKRLLPIEKMMTLRESEMALRQIFKTLSKEEKQEWVVRAEELRGGFDGGNADSGGTNASAGDLKGQSRSNLSLLEYYIRCRRCEYQQLRSKELSSSDKFFTLRNADSELRLMWKTLSKSERDEWEMKYNEHLHQAEQNVEHFPRPNVAVSVESVKDPEEISLGAQRSSVSVSGSQPFLSTNHAAAYIEVPLPEYALLGSPVDFISDSKVEHEESLPLIGAPKSDTKGATMSVETVELASCGAVSSSKCEEEKIDGGSSMNPNSSGDDIVSSAVALSDAGFPEPTCWGDVLERKAPSPTSVMQAINRTPTRKTCPSFAVPKAKKKSRASFEINHRWCLSSLQISSCYNASMEHYNTVMRTVKARDLTQELQDGFDLLRERGRGRFDMELPMFETEEYNFLNNLEMSPWKQIVKTILGEEAVLIHKGVFLSMPGAETQAYHQDGVHLTTQYQRPCHAINVFVPLVDLTAKNGPTEFCLGSHILGNESYDRDFVEIPTVSAGTPVIFDYRLGHRGLGNSSTECRPIVYCTYARGTQGKDFRDSVNFSRRRYRKLGDMVEAPLSREERSEKRRRVLEQRDDPGAFDG